MKALLLLVLMPSFASGAEYEDVTLKTLLADSDVAALVTMDRPAWTTERVAISAEHEGCGQYPLARYHFTVLEVLKGIGKAAPTGAIAAASAHAPRSIELSLQTCLTGKRGPEPVFNRYQFGVSPAAGDKLVVFLKRSDKWGWQLAAVDAFDSSNQANKVRNWARKAR